MKDSRNSSPIRRSTNESAEQIQEEIRQRAYELYEARGRGDGSDLDDWLMAEAEIAEKAQAKAA
jgi:hypothetical protein